MRKYISIATVLLALDQAQQQPATQDLLDQIQGLLNQLRIAVTTVHVTDSNGLTAALKNSGYIELAPGTYTGNFTTTTAKVTVTGPVTAILEPQDKLQPVFQVSSDDLTLRGFAIHNGAPDRDTVVAGSNSATTAEAQPHRVTFDGLTIQAGALGGHRAIALHGSTMTVTNCRILNFWEHGRDSQGVWINDGPGPYTITNNYIEASGENVLSGGDNVAIPNMIPTNIIVRGNTFYKPDSWRADKAIVVKNLFELKNALHAVIENNTLDGNWSGQGQDGSALLLTARNQYGTCAWCQVDDVVIRGNTIKRNTDGPAINILGKDTNFPSGQTQTVTIDRNLFLDSPMGLRIGNGVLTALTVTNNTMPAIKGSFIQFTGAGVSPLTFRANVTPSGNYGIVGDGTAPGTPTLTKYATILDFTLNVIEKTAARVIPYPAGNTLLAPGELKGLLDPVTFKLKDSSIGY